jgi:hypothetical protein
LDEGGGTLRVKNSGPIGEKFTIFIINPRRTGSSVPDGRSKVMQLGTTRRHQGGEEEEEDEEELEDESNSKMHSDLGR